MFEVAFLSDRGLQREHNEDAILINKTAATFIVADGMGGHEKGEIASKLLVESFVNIPEKHTYANLGQDDDTIVPSPGIDEELNHCIEDATEKITSYAKGRGIESTIGTTVVGLKYVRNIHAWALFHLGDSRAYLFSDNSITQLTTDHSKYEAMKQKNMSQEEIENTGKNIITKAVGNFNTFSLDIHYITTKKNDIFLLCSDGISDLCSKEELLRLTIQYKENLNLLCTQIKNLIYTRGAKDNLSIIAIRT